MLLTGPVLAADTDPADLPWEKAYLNLGWFFADTNSSFPSVRVMSVPVSVSM